MGSGEELEVEIEAGRLRKVELVAAHRRAEVAGVTELAPGTVLAVLRKL